MEISVAIWLPSILVMFSVLLYRYLTRSFDYWEKRGIPYRPAVPLLGSLASVFFKVAHEEEVQRHKEHGRIHGLFEGSNPQLTVADPEIVKNILVKDFHIFVNRRNFAVSDQIMDKMLLVLEGETWKRVRTIITPTFSTGKIKKMMDIIIGSTKSLSQQLRQFADSKTTFDAKKLYNCFTMDVIASAAFGTKIDSHQDPNNNFVVYARKAFSTDIPWRFIIFMMFPKLASLLRISVFPSDAMGFFKDVTLKLIEERRKSNKKYNDFLQLLMDAADESDSEHTSHDNSGGAQESVISDMGHEEGNELLFKPSRQYKSLSHDEMVSQSVLFFLAGFHTTALTLSFATYLMATNPEQQETLIEEVDKTIKENENKLTYDAVQNMKYLDKVVWETLRMYPPFIRTDRLAQEDYELGAYNLTIPKGMTIVIPVYVIQHDPEFYPEPEKFDPERFSPEEKSRRHPYAYLPFGAGPRNCVGMRFALLEIKICLAYIFSQYRIKKSKKTKIPLDFFVGQGLMQPKEVPLDVEVRQDKVFSG